MPPQTDNSPARATRTPTRTQVTTMTWVTLGMVPALWVVELTGPESVNLALRALWVALALSTVAAGVLRVIVLRRRSGRSPGTGEAHGSAEAHR